MSTRAKRIVRRPNRFLESSDEDDSDSDTPNPIHSPEPSLKPPSDSEVTNPQQPKVSTRAGRSTKRPIRFQDSGDLKSGKSVRRCDVCVGTEKNRLVGIGLQIRLPRKDIKWIQCLICEKWFHHQCVDEDLEELDISLEWICPEC